MSAVVIGPGLGRDGQVHGMTKLVVDWAKQKSIPLVFDGVRMLILFSCEEGL